MDHLFPDWNFDGDFPNTNQKMSSGSDDELVELLWRNGQLVLNSQTQKKPALDHNQSVHVDKHMNQEEAKAPSSCNFMDNQETIPWIQYPFDEYSFEKDLSSNFFPEISHSQQHETDQMPPPRFMLSEEKAAKERPASGTTAGPSHCASNQFMVNEDAQREDVVACDGRNTKYACDPNASSFSGGSACSADRTSKETSGGSTCSKRKSVVSEEYSESQSEAAENKSTQRSRSARRSRAAEVHNLSERKRRDRINARMKALQELIPHCNKTDKASILDEAIEYLKSLQIQLQVMWMGSGMAQMVFSGVQPYMPHMNMGMSPAPMMPPPQNYPIRAPAMQNPGVGSQSPTLNQMQVQRQNQALSEHLSRYMRGSRHVQAAKSQGLQQGPSSSVGPSVSTDNGALSSKKGKLL